MWLTKHHYCLCDKEPKKTKFLKMASITEFRCNKNGCKFTVTGEDADDLMECLNFHKNSKHNNLGSLPNEILIKILGYVVSSPLSCPQGEILRLGPVSKRFNELTKVAELHKGINLTCCKDHCSSEPNKVLIKRRRAADIVVYGRKYY